VAAALIYRGLGPQEALSDRYRPQVSDNYTVIPSLWHSSETFPNKFPNGRESSINFLTRSRGFDGVYHDKNRRPMRRSNDRNIAGRSVLSRTGLVSNLPRRW
jgi:hypothetical protein